MLNGIVSFFSGKCATNNAREKVLLDVLTKLENQLETDGKTLTSLLVAIEGGTTRNGIRRGFSRVNNCFRYLLRISNDENFSQVRRSLQTLGTSQKFAAHLNRAVSLEETILNWKKEVVQQFAVEVRLREAEDRIKRLVENDLFDQYCKKHNSEIDDLEANYMLKCQKSGNTHTTPSDGKRRQCVSKRLRSTEKPEDDGLFSRKKKRRGDTSSSGKKREHRIYRNYRAKLRS